ncbi:hypothetical protein ACOMHN_061913 [Nucella lapillus]
MATRHSTGSRLVHFKRQRRHEEASGGHIDDKGQFEDDDRDCSGDNAGDEVFQDSLSPIPYVPPFLIPSSLHPLPPCSYSPLPSIFHPPSLHSPPPPPHIPVLLLPCPPTSHLLPSLVFPERGTHGHPAWRTADNTSGWRVGRQDCDPPGASHVCFLRPSFPWERGRMQEKQIN